MARRKLAGLRAILTGASSGVGWQLALQLAQKRVRLIAVARRAERLQQLEQAVHEVGGAITIVPGDVCESELRHNICSITRDQFGGLDLLINNAGITALGPFAEADERRLRQIMEVNFFAPAELTRLALPLLKSGNSPAIVNVGSVLGHRAVPLKSEYCASKFALHGFSDALRAELQRDGIDLVLVSPSTIASELFEAAIADTSGRDWKAKRGMSPAKVAAKIIRAIETGRHEVIISAGGKMLVWLDRLAPSLMNRILARFG